VKVVVSTGSCPQICKYAFIIHDPLSPPELCVWLLLLQQWHKYATYICTHLIAACHMCLCVVRRNVPFHAFYNIHTPWSKLW
jgi:hypothetical protein